LWQRDATGAVEFEQEGSTQITGVTQTGVTNTASITGATGRVNYDRLKLGINAGTADLTAQRNGVNVTSQSGVTAGQTVTFTGSPRASSPDWTINANFNGLPLTSVDTYYANDTVYSSNPGLFTRTTTLNGSGSVISGKLHATKTNQGNLLAIYVNGDTAVSTSNFSDTYTIELTNYTGSFSDPKITFAEGHQSAGGFNTRSVVLRSQGGSAKATLTASRNKVTTVG